MSVDDELRSEAQQEIRKTLSLCNFYSHKVGMSFIDEPPTSFFGKFANSCAFVTHTVLLLCLVFGEIAYLATLLAKNTSVAEFVASMHIVGYGAISKELPKFLLT